MRGLLARRRRQEQDLDRELAYHLERRVQDLVQSGLSEADAQRRAAIEFGGLTLVKEEVRDSWLWQAPDTFIRDVRQAAHSLRRNWDFALGAGIILALGIAVNTATFSVVNAVLLQPLPYPGADRIVAVETRWTNTGLVDPGVSGPDFLDWQAEDGVFDVLAHSNGEDEMAITVDGRGGFGNLRSVSGDFFAVFGLPASAGRLLRGDDAPSIRGSTAPLPVVVGHGWAVTNFGSAAAAVGKSFLLYRSSVEIVGVAAPGFQYPDATNIWIPSGPTDNANRNNQEYIVVGRLKAGVSVASGQAALHGVGNRQAAQHPGNRFKNVALVPLQAKLTGEVRDTLWMLMGAVALTFFIGCANIANLLLARSKFRARELALRSALGAGRGRIVRQLLTESGVLTSVAAGVGVLLASALVKSFVAWVPDDLPRMDEARVDTTVLLFALGLSALSVLLVSLLPALTASRPDLAMALNQGGTRSVGSGSGSRLRSALVVAEVALSIVLLTGAGLLLRSFQRLHAQDLGFTTDRVVSVYTQYALGEGRSRPIRTAFYRELLPRVRALPGVVAAAGVSRPPLGEEASTPADLIVEGRQAGPPGARPQAFSSSISTGFFETLHIPLLAGRDFSDADTPATPRVVIVNASLARAMFPGESAIGHRISGDVNGPWLEIVGVVADTRWRDPAVAPRPEYYNASGQGVGGSLTIVARTAGSDRAVAQSLRVLLQELDPSVPIRTGTLDDMFGSAVAYPRFRTQLVSVFGSLGLLLSTVGIFSVLVYLVGQRRREIAVRLAVGAAPLDVVRLVVGQGLRLVAAGLVCGLAGAVAAAQALTGFLYDTSPWDAGTYVGAVGVLGLAAILAMLPPAWRAATVDPLTALREE